MANRVKGITVEIGGDTKGLDKALSGVNKSIRETQGELKDVERLLKLDPTNVELLAQKQRLLAQAVDQTEDKLDSLKEAEKQVQDQFRKGKVSQEQYDRLKREIIQTESKLDGFKSAAREANKAVERIDEDPVEDVKRAADSAADSLDNAGDSAHTFGDVLSAGAVIEGVKSIVGAVGELRDATEEYRKVMGTLEVSSEAAGYTAEQTDQAYTRLFGVLGDEQATATTVANLQAMGLRQSQLLDLIDVTTGAWAKYGDSIPIDGLAESINETARVGKVTGTLADALNWAGQNEDKFNEKLAQTKSDAERAQLIISTLKSQGLDKMADGWRENNAGIVEANEAQADYMANAREIAEKTDPAAVAAKKGMADVLGKIAEGLENVDMEALATNIGKIFGYLGEGMGWLVENSDVVLGFLGGLVAVLTALKGMELVAWVGFLTKGINQFALAFPGLTTAVTGFLSNPYVLMVAAVVGLVALVGVKGDELQNHLKKADKYLQNVFAKDWTETFGPVLGEPVNTFFAHMRNMWDGFNEHLNGMIDFWRGVFTGDWERVWTGVKEVFSGIWKQMVTVASGPINSIIGMINGMVGAVESGVNSIINLINKIPNINIPSIDLPRIPEIGTPRPGGSGNSPIINNRPKPTYPRLPNFGGGGTGLNPNGFGRNAGPAVNIVQNNYSPKALSTMDGYRNMQQLERTVRRTVRT